MDDEAITPDSETATVDEHVAQPVVDGGASIDGDLAEVDKQLENDGVPPSAPELPEVSRTCRKCSATVATRDLECPICGSSYLRKGLGRTGRILLVTGFLILVGAIVGGFAYSSHQADVRAEKAREVERDKAEAKADAEAEEQRLLDEAEAEAAQAAADLELARSEAQKQLETWITRDAKKMVREGVLDGPILLTQCDPAAGGVDDLTATTESYSCLVATEREGTQLRGYSVTGGINYETGGMTREYDDF